MIESDRRCQSYSILHYCKSFFSFQIQVWKLSKEMIIWTWMISLVKVRDEKEVISYSINVTS